MSEPADLTMEIDGHAVDGRTIKVTNAGDGLSESMKIKPHGLQIGDEGYLLMSFKVVGSNFKPKDKKDADGDYVREDVFKAGTALVVTDNVSIKKLIDKQTAAVAELRLQQKEEKEGLKRIPFDDGGTDADQAAEDGVTPGGLASVPDIDPEDDPAE